MAITSLRIRGFKCFADSGQFPIAPLTVIVGRNSSGKSSILQPWLLLKQTIESRGFANTINLKGGIYDAGTYKDIVHAHDTSKAIVLDVGIRIDDPARDLSRTEGPIPWLQLRETLERSGPVNAVVQLTISQVEFLGTQLKEIRVSLPGRPELSVKYETSQEKPMEGKWVLESPVSKRWATFPGRGPYGESMFPMLLELYDDIGETKQRFHRYAVSPDVAQYNMVLTLLESFVRDIRALGPFRTPPERRYEFAGKDFPDVGLTGKATIDALIADSMGTRKRTLEEISEWFSKAGLADGLDLVPQQDDPPSYQVRFKVGGTDANYPDVGFGLSQVLPVLVQGLRTPKGAMFLCQQPELHLHPDAQVALADFLVTLVTGKRHVMVETHSEHVVLGIRRILAEGKLKKKARITREGVSLLFVDDSTPGSSRVGPLTLDEDMNITNWPAGFMDQALQERLRIMEAVVGERGGE